MYTRAPQCRGGQCVLAIPSSRHCPSGTRARLESAVLRSGCTSWYILVSRALRILAFSVARAFLCPAIVETAHVPFCPLKLLRVGVLHGRRHHMSRQVVTEAIQPKRLVNGIALHVSPLLHVLYFTVVVG